MPGECLGVRPWPGKHQSPSREAKQHRNASPDIWLRLDFSHKPKFQKRTFLQGLSGPRWGLGRRRPLWMDIYKTMPLWSDSIAHAGSQPPVSVYASSFAKCSFQPRGSFPFLGYILPKHLDSILKQFSLICILFDLGSKRTRLFGWCF